MTTPGSRQEFATQPDDQNDAWANDMHIRTSETVAHDVEFQYSGEGEALRAENARYREEEAKRAAAAIKRRKLGKYIGIPSLVALVGGGLFVAGTNYGGGDTEPGPAPADPGAVGPEIPGAAGPVESDPAPVEEDPYGIAHLDLPPEAIEWVEANHLYFDQDELVGTFFANQYYEDVTQASRELPVGWNENFEPSTTPQGKMPNMVKPQIDYTKDLNDPATVLEAFNTGFVFPMQAYITATAANPHMVNEIREEFVAVAGNRAEPEDTELLLDWLDSIVDEHGSNSVIMIRQAHTDKTINEFDEDMQAVGWTSFRTYDGEKLFAEPTRVIEDPESPDGAKKVRGVDFAADVAFEVTSFDEKGAVSFNDTVYYTAVLSANFDPTGNDTSNTIYPGIGTAIGDLPPYKP